MNEQRNFFILFFVMFIAFWGYEYLFPQQAPEPDQSIEQTKSAALPEPAVVQMSMPVLSKDEALQINQRIQISTPTLFGSINLKGAKFDDMVLKHYKESMETDSKLVSLLNPENTQNPFFVQFGWESLVKNSMVTLPNESTIWKASSNTLTPESPIVLTWKSPEGVIFEREVAVDDQHMFTVKNTVRNTTTKKLSLASTGLVIRAGEMQAADSRVLHEGIVGYLDKKLREVNYADVESDKAYSFESSGGWLGITDKYWMAALAVKDNTPVSAKVYYADNGRKTYYTQINSLPMEVKSGDEASFTYQFIAGPKVVNVLDVYEQQYGISNLDLAVDFGWLYFLTKPLYHLLTWLKNLIGNFALAILALTVLVKLFMFPLVRKSSSSMAAMKRLQPEMDRIRKLYPEDAAKRNQAIMELYKQHKINPAGGCLPMLIQMPVFFGLYKVLYISIEMRHAPFFGWIQDMSVADPTTIFNLFGVIPWDPPSFLMIGVWPILMGFSMWLQQRLTPQPATGDPAMTQMMAFLPLFLTYVMSSFPAGLVIYWTWSNVLTIIQQYVLNKTAVAKA